MEDVQLRGYQKPVALTLTGAAAIAWIALIADWAMEEDHAQQITASPVVPSSSPPSEPEAVPAPSSVRSDSCAAIRTRVADYTALTYAQPASDFTDWARKELIEFQVQLANCESHR